MIINLMAKEAIVAGKVIPPSGEVARAVEMFEKTREGIDGIPVFKKIGEHYWNLPSPKEGIWYLVSGYVYSVAKRLRREDVISLYNESSGSSKRSPESGVTGFIK